MNRRLTALIGIVALVALTGCAGLAGTATPTGGDDAALERSIEVTATGEATTAPDRATLRVAVTATGPDAAAVRDDLAASEESLRQALLEYGLKPDAIRTERFDVSQSYETREDPNRSRYEGVHQYAIELGDVDAVGEVIDVAVDAGADRVQRVQFGLSDERERELREEAITDAMANADADAAVIANASDLEVVGVYEVSTARSGSPFYVERFAAADGASGASTSIQTGDVNVRVSVNVVYEAAPA